ncbi:hypothetical protein HELRODRAFT_183324 [Helobdella robusta]|uniref:Uncharacterized protein n=1 Tax=Helobdella robusta TaxID=6412 RepID=T1FJG4_HELRO|nr:hypothetical protein HELRODRAFT_183324 [Helobdella robusta]ESO11311.1 hypothetical protein HELRODRAFT_183324 [Helobdella robusta]
MQQDSAFFKFEKNSSTYLNNTFKSFKNNFNKRMIYLSNKKFITRKTKINKTAKFNYKSTRFKNFMRPKSCSTLPSAHFHNKRLPLKQSKIHPWKFKKKMKWSAQFTYRYNSHTPHANRILSRITHKIGKNISKSFATRLQYIATRIYRPFRRKIKSNNDNVIKFRIEKITKFQNVEKITHDEEFYIRFKRHEKPNRLHELINIRKKREEMDDDEDEKKSTRPRRKTSRRRSRMPSTTPQPPNSALSFIFLVAIGSLVGYLVWKFCYKKKKREPATEEPKQNEEMEKDGEKKDGVDEKKDNEEGDETNDEEKKEKIESAEEDGEGEAEQEKNEEEKGDEKQAAKVARKKAGKKKGRRGRENDHKKGKKDKAEKNKAKVGNDKAENSKAKIFILLFYLLHPKNDKYFSNNTSNETNHFVNHFEIHSNSSFVKEQINKSNILPIISNSTNATETGKGKRMRDERSDASPLKTARKPNHSLQRHVSRVRRQYEDNVDFPSIFSPSFRRRWTGSTTPAPGGQLVPLYIFLALLAFGAVIACFCCCRKGSKKEKRKNDKKKTETETPPAVQQVAPEEKKVADGTEPQTVPELSNEKQKNVNFENNTTNTDPEKKDETVDKTAEKVEKAEEDDGFDDEEEEKQDKEKAKPGAKKKRKKSLPKKKNKLKGRAGKKTTRPKRNLKARLRARRKPAK